MKASKPIHARYEKNKASLNLEQYNSKPGELCHMISAQMKHNIILFLNDDKSCKDNVNLKAAYPTENSYKLLLIVEYLPGKKSKSSKFSSVKVNRKNSKVISKSLQLFTL